LPELLAAGLMRDIPDFPQPGILFKDITPVLANGPALQEVVDCFVEWAAERSPDVVVSVESRGFIFGVPIALALGVGFVPIRKAGKLPFRTVRQEYTLEYGVNVVEVHQDALKPGQRVLIVDDLLATGGTAAAAAALVERLGAKVVGISFFVELGFLPGRALLSGYDLQTLITYP